MNSVQLSFPTSRNHLLWMWELSDLFNFGEDIWNLWEWIRQESNFNEPQSSQKLVLGRVVGGCIFRMEIFAPGNWSYFSDSIVGWAVSRQNLVRKWEHWALMSHVYLSGHSGGNWKAGVPVKMCTNYFVTLESFHQAKNGMRRKKKGGKSPNLKNIMCSIKNLRL